MSFLMGVAVSITSRVLYELSRKIIILNDTNYELFGYIAADNKYIKVNTVVVDPAAPGGDADPDTSASSSKDFKYD